jgi:hypothetical protein
MNSQACFSTFRATTSALAVAGLVLFATLGPARAGGSFGPGPFRNGSPLVSGTDGVYECVATAKNATGIIRWQINNGAQTAATADNKWIMFVDGEVLSGQTSANISNGKVAGVLDTTVSGSLPTNDDGSISLPIVFVVPGNAGAGSFTGKIDLNSPIAAITGKGILSGTPARTDQIVFIANIPEDGFLGFSPVTITPLTIPGSTLGDIKFKLRGSRLSTLVLASSQGQQTAN